MSIKASSHDLDRPPRLHQLQGKISNYHHITLIHPTIAFKATYKMYYPIITSVAATLILASTIIAQT